MEPIRVLQICDHLGWEGSRMHGAKRILEWMIPRFDPRRFAVQLLSLRRRDLSEETLESRGIRVTYLEKGRFDPRTFPALVRFLRRERIEIVHMHGYGASTFGRLAAAWLRIPAILHEHANIPHPPRYQMLADWLLAPLTAHTIAVSETVRDFLVRTRKIPRGRIELLYFGAPLETFHPRPSAEREASRARWGIPPGAPLVGTITRLHDQKGNRYLLEAAPTILREVPAAFFLIAGEGPLRGALEELARSLGVAERVVFTGFQPDVALIISLLDVQVFPSLWEGTPLTVFESLAMGRAIVSTDVDGLRDVLEEGRTALLVPPRDPEALAEKVIVLLKNPALRAKLAEGAAQEAGRFDIRHFIRRMESLYEELVLPRRGRR